MKKLLLLTFLVANAAFGATFYPPQPSVTLQPAGNNAIAFANKLNITDQNVRADLIGFASELQLAGINTSNGDQSQTNMVDAMLLHSRFKATSNSLSWAGATITASNITYSTWGAGFTGKSLMSCNIADSRTNTFVIIWRGYLSNYNVATQQWLGGLVNTDPTKQSAQWFYMPNTSLRFTFRETNTFYQSLGGESFIDPWYVIAYDSTDLAGRFYERRVTASTCSGVGGGGLYTFWNDGVTAKIGTSTPLVTVTNVAIVPTNALNQILLGVDNLGPGGGFFGGYLTAEISAVLVFNKPLTTNQMLSVYHAARWLEPGNVNYIFYGQSESVVDAFSNSIPTFMFTGPIFTNNMFTWRNSSQSGRKLAEYVSAANSNNWLYVDAPYGKVTETRLYAFLGINDAYGNVDSTANMSNNLFGIIAQANTLGIKPYIFTSYGLWTNSNSAYTYNAGIEASLDGLNDTIVTNYGKFAGVIRADLLIGQNELNTNNGMSYDGLHISPNAKGFQLMAKVADLALGVIGVGTLPNIGGRQLGSTLSNGIYGDLGINGNGTLYAPLISSTPGNGTDQAGIATSISGGKSTGTGRGGSVILQTTPSAAGTGSALNTFSTRHFISAKPVVLTKSVATTVFNVTLATGKSLGIRLYSTTKATDATDFQARSDSVFISAVNKAATVTTAISTEGTGDSASAVSAGAMTCTWTAVANAASVDVKCTSVPSLTPSAGLLQVFWRIEIDTDDTAAVITAQ